MIVAVDKERPHPLLPLPVQTTHANDNQASCSGQQRNGSGDYERACPDASTLVPKSRSWSDPLRIRNLLGGAAFYRYVLAEMFGASLTGSGLRRPRSAGILCYRGYVAATRSDLVQATDDTICLLLPGCSMMDPDILIEGRKRHLVSVRCMQKALEGGTEDVPGTKDVISTIAGALELLFVEIFKPVSLGPESLYGGLVHLVRNHWQVLTSSQVPVTRFLLAQVRQVLLMESLASRTTLPIAVEAWQCIPHASGLISDMTETLMPLAIQVPALLATARAVQQSDPTDPSTFNDALLGLLTLERSLIQWQRNYCPDTSGAISAQYLSQPLKESAVLCQGEHAHSMEESHDLPFLSAQCLTLCYICVHLLQESVVKISAARGDSTLNDAYVAHATWTADILCRLAEYFIQNGDGLLSKALSACAPLHFARQWYEMNEQRERAAAAKDQELWAQKEVPFLSWRSLLPLSFPSLYMHA